MPVNKNAFLRIRHIDGMLSDPNHSYTTAAIHNKIIGLGFDVSLRQIQKDINTIVEECDKPLDPDAYKRGYVKYLDQTSPIFYMQLTSDEEHLLREVLKSLGQFEGMDNFSSLNLLKKKLSIDADKIDPVISFSKNDGLQVPETLLGRLFTAITLKKVIRISYTPFSRPTFQITVYPYLLKQFNDRWFLVCTPLADDKFPYRPEFFINFALDRMDEKFDYVDNESYIDTPVDLKSRFEEIIGVTFYEDKDLEYVYYAVQPQTLPYVQTKWMHSTQQPMDPEFEQEYKQKYPSLSDCKFFSIECRPNVELYNRFAAYGDSVIIVEPEFMRQEMARRMKQAADIYSDLEK